MRGAFSRLLGGTTTADAREARMEAVRGSGPVLAAARVSARIGDVWFRGPFLHIQVYPGGIVAKPALLPVTVIPRSEIRKVAVGLGTFGRRHEVWHDGLDSVSPLVVYGSQDRPLIRELARLGSESPEGGDSPRDGVRATASPATGMSAVSPGLLVALRLLGVAVAVLLVAFGVLWVVPNIGWPGLVWTGALLVIALLNLRFVLPR